LPLSGCPFKDYSLEGLSPKPGLALWFCSYAWLCGYLRDKPVYSGSQGTFLLAYFPALTCVYAQALSFAAQHVCANLKAKKLKKEYLKLQA
jgi:hypothetical protein